MSLPFNDPSNPALPSPLFSDVTAVRGDHLRANNNAIFTDLSYLDTTMDARWLRTIFGDNAYGSTLVTDLDSIAKSGFYTCYGTAAGVPDAGFSWFVLHQNSAVGAVSMYQRAVAYSTTIIVFERMKIASTWGAWRETGAEAVGSEKMFFGDVAPRGWLIEDGKSLALTGGDYNDTKYYALYAHIWDLVNRTVVPSTYLSAAKGANAAADWSANKKIYLPNRQALSPKGAGTQTLNTRSKIGPALGVPEEDQFELHGHKITTGTTNTLASSASVPNLYNSSGELTDKVTAPVSDGVNVLRAGATTRDCTLGTNFIIKI